MDNNLKISNRHLHKSALLNKTCVVRKLGMMAYNDAHRKQKELHRQRVAGAIADTLLLLEHPPTFTIGKSGNLKNILISEEKRLKEGIDLFFVERGGDVTYHGPGQLVIYPIIDLKDRGKDVGGFVRNLEKVTIRTLKDFGIHAVRDESHAGVWVGREEVAAIGLCLRKWVTMHGLAINVNTNLEHFALINPCGLPDRKATSISKLVGRRTPMKAVIKQFLLHFANVFDNNLLMYSEAEGERKV